MVVVSVLHGGEESSQQLQHHLTGDTATMCGTCRLLFDGIFWMEDKSRKWLVIAFVVAHLMGGASYCIVDA
jgi:hypothetical protein